jgi:hypothetical protein
MIKTLVFAALAACGVSSTTARADPPEQPTEPPEFAPPPEPPPKDSHWCCHSVDLKTKSGEGCNAFSGAIELINACAEYLYCSGDAGKSNGKTQCL